MFTARHKTTLHRNAPGSSDNLHLHAIEVLVLTGTASPIHFSFQQLTPADANIVAHCQGKTIQDIAARAVELFDNSSHLLEKTVKQVCQPMQALGESTFQGQIRSHVMSTHVVNS